MKTRRLVGVALADAVHRARGTRGLTVAAGLLVVFAALEPTFEDWFPKILYTLPLVVLGVVGLVTLPREGVAVHARALAVLEDPRGPKRMLRRAVLGAAVCLSLFPSIFLAVQGVPHLSPLAGLAPPELVRWIGLVGLVVVVLLVVLYLRSSRGYAAEISTPRKDELDDDAEARRDVLGLSLVVILVAWAWMLQGFWRPFSLLEWHGGDLEAYFASLELGARGVAGIAFAVVPPALLFIVLSAHLNLLWQVGRRRLWKEKKSVVALAWVHVAFCVVGVVLHMYNVLWIVRFRTLGFL